MPTNVAALVERRLIRSATAAAVRLVQAVTLCCRASCGAARRTSRTKTLTGRCGAGRCLCRETTGESVSRVACVRRG